MAEQTSDTQKILSEVASVMPQEGGLLDVHPRTTRYGTAVAICGDAAGLARLGLELLKLAASWNGTRSRHHLNKSAFHNHSWVKEVEIILDPESSFHPRSGARKGGSARFYNWLWNVFMIAIVLLVLAIGFLAILGIRSLWVQS